MENDELIPCDLHQDKGYIKMHIKDDGSIQFMCFDCLSDFWKLTPKDKWEEILRETM